MSESPKMKNSIKEKGINDLLRRYYFEPDHAEQVRKLSLLIFDKTKESLHEFSDNDRDLLEAGSLLHDIGYCISAEKHNKHSYDLITKNGIEGYNDDEIAIIANIARYHRGKSPQKAHSNYSKLPNNNVKNLVRKLSAIIKLADGLDRSHLNVVEDLECSYDYFSKILYIIIKLNISDCGLEIWAAERKKELFEEEFGVRIVFRVK